MHAQTHLPAGPGSQTHTDTAPLLAGVSDLGSPLGPVYLAHSLIASELSASNRLGNWPPQRSETTSGA